MNNRMLLVTYKVIKYKIVLVGSLNSVLKLSYDFFIYLSSKISPVDSIWHL